MIPEREKLTQTAATAGTSATPPNINLTCLMGDWLRSLDILLRVLFFSSFFLRWPELVWQISGTIAVSLRFERCFFFLPTLHVIFFIVLSLHRRDDDFLIIHKKHLRRDFEKGAEVDNGKMGAEGGAGRGRDQKVKHCVRNVA